MGWLNWSYADTMATDVIAVQRALAGKTALLKIEHGIVDKPGPKERSKVTAAGFKAFAERHNARRKANGRG